MLLKFLKKYFKLNLLAEEFRKIGVNFFTGGIVGVFINHFVGTKYSTMFWTALWITSMGAVFLALGTFKIRGKK